MYLLLLVGIALLQVLDWATTEAIIKRGGRELNPVMIWLFARYGRTASFVGKGVFVVCASVILYLYAPLALLPLFVGYVGVILWNCSQLLFNLPKR